MIVRTAEELAGLKRVGQLVARTLDVMERLVAPGVTTAELDQAAEAYAVAEGAQSSPRMTYNFPGFTCISVNEQVVHGVPGPRVIEPGDIVKIDVTLYLDGFLGDSARSVLVTPVSDAVTRLHAAALEAFDAGCAAAQVGNRVRDVGAAVGAVAAAHGLQVLRQLSGHGIGRKLHEPPDVPNWDDPDATMVLRDGMVFALEPMFSVSDPTVVDEKDGWTVRTRRRSLAIHHEHTIMVRAGQLPLILTAAALQ
ncbi:MAG: type I methionyl aminopeptidase [Acidobacteria bacterium]|nr:type I methionyl aminopeptidase [Acidobacteriota bacterium]